MLSHGNITSNVMLSLARIQLTGEDECLSFLPLSHIFERMAGHYLMLQCGVLINYAGGIDTVSADMLERRPSVMLLGAAPLREDPRAGAGERGLAGSALKRRIFRWAAATGARWAEARIGGRGAHGPPAVPPARRPAGVLEAARAHRRPAALLRLGRRPAQPGHRAVLLRGGAADPGGLRPHGDVARDRREHLRGLPHRHGGQADPAGRRCGSRRTARSSPAGRTSCRATTTSRRRRARRSRPTAGSTRATSAS